MMARQKTLSGFPALTGRYNNIATISYNQNAIKNPKNTKIERNNDPTGLFSLDGSRISLGLSTRDIIQ